MFLRAKRANQQSNGGLAAGDADEDREELVTSPFSFARSPPKPATILVIDKIKINMIRTTKRCIR